MPLGQPRATSCNLRSARHFEREDAESRNIHEQLEYANGGTRLKKNKDYLAHRRRLFFPPPFALHKTKTNTSYLFLQRWIHARGRNNRPTSRHRATNTPMQQELSRRRRDECSDTDGRGRQAIPLAEELPEEARQTTRWSAGLLIARMLAVGHLQGPGAATETVGFPSPHLASSLPFFLALAGRNKCRQ
jgi:hypothetical protein